VRKLASAAPRPRATGSMPAPIATVVMTIGRARLRQVVDVDGQFVCYSMPSSEGCCNTRLSNWSVVKPS
jgi:hypothetical protein